MIRGAPRGARVPAAAHAARAADASLELGHRFAPVVRLVEQKEPCGHGEPYVPTDVNHVLGSTEVALRGPWDTTNIVKVAPTGADLGHGLFGYHLHFPGDAVSPGCVYDEWSHRINQGSERHGDLDGGDRRRPRGERRLRLPTTCSSPTSTNGTTETGDVLPAERPTALAPN